MANEQYPLLLFPTPDTAERNKLGGGGGRLHFPAGARQAERIAPQLATLQDAFQAKRLRVQADAPLENPELILVIEIAGAIDDLHKAVSRIPGLEWLFDLVADDASPDEDFYYTEERRQGKNVPGTMYLLGSNFEALQQLLGMWNRFQANREAKFEKNLAPLKHLFKQLRNIRPWDVTDRVGADVRHYWEDCLGMLDPTVRFEIEAWYSQSDAKNVATTDEIETEIARLQGRVLDRALIKEIAYHGFLVELPSEAIRAILDGNVPQLLLSDRIMFFRPRGQSIAGKAEETDPIPAIAVGAGSAGNPVIALLDGLPLANHALLADRLVIDDPDGWSANYEAKDRVHGTAMASLILHGQLDGATAPLARKLYVRPIMRADARDAFNARRREHTPDDTLLMDLVHRAVVRICQGEGEAPPAAPSVRVINLSLGDPNRIFVRTLSPWARLLDWLSHRYSILFIVSAGNVPSSLTLATPRDSLGGLTIAQRQALAAAALLEQSIDRRLMAPAESINALTVGALHSDAAANPTAPLRFDLFAANSPSPLSRVGPGYRRSVKPEILLPGGRVFHLEQYGGDPGSSLVDIIDSAAAPGHRTAIPSLQGGQLTDTAYSRGTSNAAALASRAAGQAHAMLETLRAEHQNAPGPLYDAVLIKALLVHGASWGALSQQLLSLRPDLDAIPNGNTRRIQKAEYVSRWLGYGPADIERALACTEQRATLLGVGDLTAEGALVFSAPLPPSLAGKKEWRRITVTLSWLSPINPSHQAYRRARMWVSSIGSELRVTRTNSVYERAALRGTVQHEVLEGKDAVPYVDGANFVCKVNCAADAGEFDGATRFALCVTLEVSVESKIPVYQEIRTRIAAPVPIRPGA